MTAPVLTPSELSEVYRFGVHDEDVLRDLSEHMDDLIPCYVSVEQATHRAGLRCCGYAMFVCAHHLGEYRAFWEAELKRNGCFCKRCGHEFAPAPFEEIVRVVPL